MSPRDGCAVIVPTVRAGQPLSAALAVMGSSWRARCVVVANGVSALEVERIRKQAPESELVTLEANVGFARAVNAGIAHARRRDDDIVVLLNDDVTVAPDGLDRLVTALREDFQAASAAGVLLQGASSTIDTAGVRCDRALTAHDVGRGEDVGHRAALPRPLGPSGGFAAYRREALDGVGDLDDGFFAYYEDLDLALRLRQAGWTSVLAREAVGRHLGSATLGWRSPEKAAIVGRSRGRIARKYGVHRRPAAWPLLIVELLAGSALCVELRTLSPLSARVAGFREAASELPYPQGLVDTPSLPSVLGDRLRRRYRPASAA